MNIQSFFRPLSLLAFILTVAQVIPVQAQQGPAWRLASEAGNLRLSRAALAAENPAGSSRVLEQMDRRLGFVGQGEPLRYALPRRFSLTPEFGYDRNFNGGLAADTVTLGNTKFIITPDSRAQPTAYFGARISAGQRFIWARGAAISVAGQATYRRGLETNNDYRALSLRTCSENQLSSYTGIDLCLARSLTYRSRSNSRLTTASAGISQLFVHDNALSEATLTLGREFRPGYGRNTAQFSMRHLSRAYGTFDLGLMVGERVVPNGLATFSASVGHGRFINDQFYHLQLRYTEETGGRLAGMRHHRKDTSIALQLPQYFGVAPTIGYTRQRNDMTSFDANFLTLSLNIKGFSF